jgi:SAM-dependent methyltransferase
MQRELIAELRCPYCNGYLQVSKSVESDGKHLRYGLLRCRCFEFPVVDGILLLSLAKGYGGAEEELQPYVPLQVAAIKHLQRGDVAGLKAWICRHLPLAAELIEGGDDTYLPFAARVADQLKRTTSEYLTRYARFEVLGYAPPASRLGQLLGTAVWRRLRELRRSARVNRSPRDYELEQLTGYYARRFFAPRVTALALQLESLPLHGRILSLCCGHGIFENLLNLIGAAENVVSIDGQFLNLLVTRRYAHPRGSYICHDLQFPLPFDAGTFDGVFASTCLPEIPAQKTFVSEAVRASRGWTFIDSIWNLAVGMQRIDRLREYRFCQNFFERLEDYLPFFEECAQGRELALDIPALPARYLEGARWVRGRAAMEAALAKREDWELSMLSGTVTTSPWPVRNWLSAETLAISPAFEIASISAETIELRRRAAFAQLDWGFAPQSFPGFPRSVSLQCARFSDPNYLLERFCDAQLVLLPRTFDRESTRLADLR